MKRIAEKVPLNVYDGLERTLSSPRTDVLQVTISEYQDADFEDEGPIDLQAPGTRGWTWFWNWEFLYVCMGDEYDDWYAVFSMEDYSIEQITKDEFMSRTDWEEDLPDLFKSEKRPVEKTLRFY